MRDSGPKTMAGATTPAADIADKWPRAARRRVRPLVNVASLRKMLHSTSCHHVFATSSGEQQCAITHSFISMASGWIRSLPTILTLSTPPPRRSVRTFPWAARQTSTGLWPPPRPLLKLTVAPRSGAHRTAGILLEVYQKHYNDIADAIREEMGAPQSWPPAPRPIAASATCRRRPRYSRTFKFEEDLGRAPGIQGADRGLRSDHALELAGQPDLLQGRARPGGGLHHGAQAQRSGAPVCLPVRPGDA